MLDITITTSTIFLNLASDSITHSTQEFISHCMLKNNLHKAPHHEYWVKVIVMPTNVTYRVHPPWRNPRVAAFPLPCPRQSESPEQDRSPESRNGWIQTNKGITSLIQILSYRPIKEKCH